MTWLTRLLSHLKPVTPTIQPTHTQSWAVTPKGKKR